MTARISSELIRRSGLDLKTIELHHARVCEFVKTGSQDKYDVISACCIENNGVIAWQSMKHFLDDTEGAGRNDSEECSKISTVILAAGAATRFFSSFVSFVCLVEQILNLKNESSPTYDKKNGRQKTPPRPNSIEQSSSQFQDIVAKSQVIRDSIRRLLPVADMKLLFELSTKEADKITVGCSQEDASSDRAMILDSANDEVHLVLSTYFLTRLYLAKFTSFPKAVVPIDPGGETLLSLNIRQQMAFCKTGILHIVVGSGTEKVFNLEIRRIKDILVSSSLINIDDLNYDLVTQGNENSTIRFTEAAEPLLNDDGTYSVVAGGHGEVIHHFNSIADTNTNTQCIHIRTIDNIFGQSDAAVSELRNLARFFFTLKRYVDVLRKEVSALINLEITGQKRIYLTTEVGIAAFAKIQELISSPVKSPTRECSELKEKKISVALVYSKLQRIFFWPTLSRDEKAIEVLMKMEKQLMRPISVFGVVQMTHDDVGGSPVFAKDGIGLQIKVCLEGAHIKEIDKKKVKMSNEERVFFNSAVTFVETEMDDLDTQGKTKVRRVNFNDIVTSDVFLIAQKQHEGQKVLYHELAMFEILSHSELVNSVFVEVSRAIFKPNKSIIDLVTTHSNH